MKQLIGNIFTALLLLIFVSTLVLWLESYFGGGDRIGHRFLRGEWEQVYDVYDSHKVVRAPGSINMYYLRSCDGVCSFVLRQEV